MKVCNIKFIINNNIFKKKAKVTFSHGAHLRSFNDLKSSIIEPELKLVAIFLSIYIIIVLAKNLVSILFLDMFSIIFIAEKIFQL